MHILVTGGAGYIGSVVVPQLLQEEHSVRLLDSLRFGGEALLSVYNHPHLEFVHGDIRDADTLKRALEGIDSVVNLAALVGEPACAKFKDEAWAINTEAVVHLLDLAKVGGAHHFLFISTCSNYGKNTSGELLDETAPLQPLSIYAETKIVAEEAVSEANGPLFHTTVFRLATVYGLAPRMRFDLLLNQFALDAYDGWILIYGADSWRPFVHVQDVAQAIVRYCRGLACANGQVINIGGHNRRKRDLVECLKLLLPSMTVGHKDEQNDPRDYQVSFEKARRLIGLDVRYTPEDGLKEIVSALKTGIITDPHSGKWRNVDPAV